MTNLTDADRAELARLLRQSIDADRFPLSPRVQRWKDLLVRLDPEPPAAADLLFGAECMGKQHHGAAEAEPLSDRTRPQNLVALLALRRAIRSVF
jgi:hypothetical protein